MNRNSENNFVWLRDRLPKDMPAIRPILYGYDTQLLKSESIQTIDDIASSFIAKLRSIGRGSLSAKPLILMAHSLGGIVVRCALTQMSSSGEEESLMLSSLKMIFFFGVPSKGMHISHLLSMVKGQPNEGLIRMLSEDSHYLSSLNQHFSGIATLKEMRLISAYETKLSRTTQVCNPILPWASSPGLNFLQLSEADTWERSGPYTLLVDQRSAIQAEAEPRNCFPINEDHSNLVKFSDDSPKYRIVVGFLDTLMQTKYLRRVPSSDLERFGQSVVSKPIDIRNRDAVADSSCTYPQ